MADIATNQAASTKLVIVPARDEEKSVREVVLSIKKRLVCDVIVVDDASGDNTATEASRGGAEVIQMPFHVGAWAATQTGLMHGLSRGYSLAITMDADGQHSATTLDAVCKPVINGESDVAIGICPARVSNARRFAWHVFKRITSLKIQDVTSGLKVYNDQAMRVLTTREAAMLNYQDIGVLLILRDAGLQVSEVNVAMKTRESGHSRIFSSWPRVFEYLAQTLILSVVKWRPSWRRNDVFISSRDSGDE